MFESNVVLEWATKYTGHDIPNHFFIEVELTKGVIFVSGITLPMLCLFPHDLFIL